MWLCFFLFIAYKRRLLTAMATLSMWFKGTVSGSMLRFSNDLQGNAIKGGVLLTASGVGQNINRKFN